jgi:citrate lyase subunit beta/citryl-CoA lyase
MLYVPANSWRMITNAAGEGADAVILDLEDACPMGEKETGRVFARDAIPALKEQGVDVFVRVNSLETGLTETDIDYVAVPGIAGIMLAKTETKEHVTAVDEMLRKQEKDRGMEPGSIELVALIETPVGIVNLRDIITASKRLVAVGFGAGDYSREMGAGMGVTGIAPDELFTMLLYARCAIATTARAFGIQAIDTPFFGLVIDLDGVARETGKVKLLGFCGKQVTHPRHVAAVNKAFTPAAAEVELAQRVVDAYRKAREQGLGATTLGGKMIDFGSFKRAESLLALGDIIREKDKRRA